MSTYDGVTGAQRLLAFGSYTAGYCLQAVARAIFGGTPTKSTHTPPHVVDQALDVWNIAPASRRHPGDRNPPAGALLLYGKRKGHIAIGTGGDRQVSTDWPSNGKIGVATIEQIEKSWGQTYLGWTDYLEGDDVTYVYPAPPASPSPTQRVVKIEQATRRDIPATNGTQLETMHAGFVHDYPAFVRSPLEGGTVGNSNVWFDGGGWFMHSSMFTDPSTTGITDETDVLYPPVVETPPPSSNDQATTEPEIPATTGDDAPSTPDPSDSDQASGPSGAEIDDSHTAVIPVTPDDPQLTPSKPTNPATPAYRPISQEDIMTLNTLPSSRSMTPVSARSWRTLPRASGSTTCGSSSASSSSVSWPRSAPLRFPRWRRWRRGGRCGSSSSSRSSPASSGPTVR